MNTQAHWQQDLENLLKEIDSYLESHEGPHYAAFDADGTCWFNDIGRDFYLHQCEGVFKDKYTWEDYLLREKNSVGESLWWLAEINSGRKLEDVLAEAQASLQKKPLKLIPSQKKLIQYLHQKKVEVYIVTASFKWSVVPAAQALGIDEAHVLGVTTLPNSNGLLGFERKDPITWREGKPKALLEVTEKTKPFLCAGNTISDLPLLKESSHFRLSVKSAPENESLSTSEQELKKISTQNDWLHFEH